MSLHRELAYPSGTTHGLTKRELFAAMAMQGYLSRPRDNEHIEDAEFDALVSRWSVESADALLAELAKDGAP